MLSRGDHPHTRAACAVPLRRRVRASSEGVVVCSLGRGWSSARARRLRARRTEERDPRICPRAPGFVPAHRFRVAVNSNVQRKDTHGFTRAGVRTRRTVCGDTKNKGEEREVYYLHSGAREALLEFLLPAALPRDDRAERRERRTG